MPSLHFTPERDQELFAAVPAAAAVFVLWPLAEGEPYVSKTTNLRRRLIRLLGAGDERTKKLKLRDRVGRIEYTPTGSDFESRLALYHAMRRLFPQQYRERLRLRPAPLVKLNLENEWPRAYITTRIGKLSGASHYYGPFPSRAAAEKFLNDSLDFFKMRRCDFDLHPDPAFPGCIYSEMKMCLAPCFKGCTGEEYAVEVARVQQYLDSGGASLRRELEAERERSSAGLQFEQAAGVHARLEKVAAAIGQRPDVARRVDRLTGVMVQTSAEPDCVTLFPLQAGRIGAAIQFPVNVVTLPAAEEKQAGGKARPQSMEARVQQALAAAPALPKATAAETMDHLALLKRWYYRGSKTGEIFLAEANGELPMRRIVRSIGRVFRGEKAAPDLNESARDYWVHRGRAAERSQ